MSQDIALREQELAVTIQSEAVRAYLRDGDLSMMPDPEKDRILVKMCAHYGLDPILRPFILLNARGEGNRAKLIWYATKSATDQMANSKSLSRRITDLGVNEEAGVITCRCEITDGERVEQSVAVVACVEFVREGGQVVKRMLSGEAYANAVMKCETKAKRRATMCWFGLPEADYDTPPSVAMNVDANVAALDKGIVEASTEDDTGTEETDQGGTENGEPKRRRGRRSRAEIEAEKLAKEQPLPPAPEAKPEERIHMADQIKASENMTPAPKPEEKPTPTGMLAKDSEGNTVGVDTTSELGTLCAKQVWAENKAKQEHGDNLQMYNRGIDMHKEQLKVVLQSLGIDWNKTEHIQIATKISVAANGKAPLMAGLTVLSVEFGKWIEAEWRKHFLKKEPVKEIPL